MERSLQAERLEPRCLLAAVVMTGWEQLLLELVNRARDDPQAEARRYGISLNEGLPSGTISAASKQPLAPNQILIGAARAHSQDMLDRDFFAHTNPNGDSPFDRMKDAGYIYTTAAENLAWTGTTGTLDRDAAIFSHHEGLLESPGHRVNIMRPAFRELGAGVRHGLFTSGGHDYNASMVTEKFGTRAGAPFVTGVVYEDAVVDDDFYSLGEALGEVRVTAVESSSGAVYATQSGRSGGYALRVPAGTYTVTAQGGPLDYPIIARNVVVEDENRKIDFDASLPPELIVWQNPVEPLDVNGNGKVEPIDALIVINFLNRSSSGAHPVLTAAPPPYLDVRGVGSVAPLDALLIINHLNRQASATGQGEYPVDSATASIDAVAIDSDLTREEHERLCQHAPLATEAHPPRYVSAFAVSHQSASRVLSSEPATARREAAENPHLQKLESVLADIAEDVQRAWG